MSFSIGGILLTCPIPTDGLIGKIFNSNTGCKTSSKHGLIPKEPERPSNSFIKPVNPVPVYLISSSDRSYFNKVPLNISPNSAFRLKHKKYDKGTKGYRITRKIGEPSNINRMVPVMPSFSFSLEPSLTYAFSNYADQYINTYTPIEMWKFLQDKPDPYYFGRCERFSWYPLYHNCNEKSIIPKIRLKFTITSDLISSILKNKNITYCTSLVVFGCRNIKDTFPTVIFSCDIGFYHTKDMRRRNFDKELLSDFKSSSLGSWIGSNTECKAFGLGLIPKEPEGCSNTECKTSGKPGGCLNTECKTSGKTGGCSNTGCKASSSAPEDNPEGYSIQNLVIYTTIHSTEKIRIRPGGKNTYLRPIISNTSSSEFIFDVGNFLGTELDLKSLLWLGMITDTGRKRKILSI